MAGAAVTQPVLGDEAMLSAAMSVCEAENRPTLSAVARKIFAGDAEFERLSRHHCSSRASTQADLIFAANNDPHDPADIFNRLRWGGLFMFVDRDARRVHEAAGRFGPIEGFLLDRGPATVRLGPWGLCIPFFSKAWHYFVARKTALIRPGSLTDRFTYDVRLFRHDANRPTNRSNPNPPKHGEYVVLKQIPDAEWVARRLASKFPEAAPDVIEQRTRKLVDKVFPVFLTREAAFLNILQRDLPPEYRDRVPRVLDLEKDSRGFVTKLYLNWLRHGVQPLSQFEFARQSIELLQAVHDIARVIHLDLRLDNVVITDRGVGFVDFGSAVRVDENLGESKMLSTLFEEMMWTSSIQQTLGKMLKQGKVTSQVISSCHHKVDKAVDLFFLAVQMNKPHSNPDLRDLVKYDPDSDEARRLAALTKDILTPADTANPPYKTASDVLAALKRLDPQNNVAA